MDKTLTYLYDPLCGWCYGAGSALERLVAESGIQLVLLPAGLFAGSGARPMTEELSSSIWINDQRIEELTGQPFTEQYRDQVLCDREQGFDSGPATLALTAVALTSPERELEALRHLQRARHVDGRNIVSREVLDALLTELHLAEAAQMLRHPARSLQDATQARIDKARQLMLSYQQPGVPGFILNAGAHNACLLNAGLLFSAPEQLLRSLQAMR